MSAISPAAPQGRITPRRVATAAVVATVGLLLTAFSVFAGLNANANSGATAFGSGTLKLTMAANGTGFTTGVTNMAPGDVVNRYVALTNGGTLDATGLGLQVADSASTKLTTDATNGLHATITSCSVAWSPTAGTCGGTTTVLVNNASLASMIATPSTIVAGAVPAGTVYNLQVSIQLPNQNETTTNGVLPAGTIQGLTSSITWTFTENQRTATTTNS